MIDILQHIINISTVFFMLWMCFRWSSEAFYDVLIKILLFIISVLSIVIELKSFNII